MIPLQTELDHVQGIEVDETRLWVTSVDRKAKQGWLHEFSITDGTLLRKTELTRGDQYHPGGIASTEKSLWIPIAEYRRSSTSTIQEVDKQTLKFKLSFSVADHIGAVAVVQGNILGANWDARQIINMSNGERRDNPQVIHYQDMKYVDGLLVGSGTAKGEGAIEWLDPVTLELKKRLTVGKTDRGVIFTNEGMAIRDGKLYLLPEDGPSRLFIFNLPE